MNDKELELLRKLEFIKYKTLVGKKIKHSNDSEIIHMTSGSSGFVLNTPEGMVLNVTDFIVNHKNPHDKGKCSIIVNWSENDDSDINDEKIIKPSVELTINDPGSIFNGRKLFVFHSEEFRDLPTADKTIQISQLTNSYLRWFHQYSVLIILTPANNDFQEFMDMEYGEQSFTLGSEPMPVYDYYYDPYSIVVYTNNSWKYFFNKAVGDALKFNNFENLLKYDFRIWKDELILENRVNLIEYFVDQQYWGILDFDGLNEQKITFELIVNISEEDKFSFYNEIFSNGGELFKKIQEKFDDDYNLKFGFFLIEIFYKNISQQNTQNLINDLENFSIDKIIPVISDLYKESLLNSANIGAIINYEYNTNGIKLNHVQIGKVILHPSTGNYTVSNFEYEILQNKEYNFDETVLALCVRDKLSAGLIKGKCYPIPAFAIPLFHNGLSEKFTLTDLISNIFDVLGIIFPFFRLAQGFAIAEVIGLTLGYTGIISGNFKNILLSSESGKNFLFYFNFVNTIYSGKGVYDAWNNYGLLMIKDYDGLSSAWSVFQGTSTYTDLVIDNQDEFIQIKNKMEKISVDIINLKKHTQL